MKRTAEMWRSRFWPPTNQNITSLVPYNCYQLLLNMRIYLNSVDLKKQRYLDVIMYFLYPAKKRKKRVSE